MHFSHTSHLQSALCALMHSNDRVFSREVCDLEHNNWMIHKMCCKKKELNNTPQKIWVSKCKILKQRKMMIRKSVYESGHQCTNSVGQSDGSCSCYTPNIINFFMVWNWGMTQALAKISSLSPFGALNTSHGLLLVNDTMQDILSFRTVPNQPINRSLLCHSTA